MFVPKSVATGKVALCVIAVVEAVLLVIMTGVVTHLMGSTPAETPLIIEGAIIASVGNAFSNIIHAIFD